MGQNISIPEEGFVEENENIPTNSSEKTDIINRHTTIKLYF